ncbi:MAG: ABC transporter ATP-binding protein [Treponema sp.]|jgi:ABC-2 type transport system ATP-binding protein|nr:ABC transporter ATP-binding protein [Treponema sp.]
MTADVIVTERIGKRYGKVRAVEDVSLDVKKGELYGFLGLNGAGKTTTIRMLLAMVRPDTGAAYINGEKVHAGNYHLWAQTGCLVETPCAYPDLSVAENLDLVRRIRGIKDEKTVNAVMEQLGLTPYRDRKAKKLSLGNVQRLGLAKALIHRPRILVLDEPTNGLDPAGIVELRRTLLDMARNDGVTVFISSHILAEIARLADRIGIMHQGRLVQEIRTDQLEQLARKRLLVTTGGLEDTRQLLEGKGYEVSYAADKGALVIGGNGVTAKPCPAASAVAALVVQAGHSLTMLKTEEEDLEGYFLQAIGMGGTVR